MYWLPLTKNKIHQNIVLLVSSYFFYGWWDWRFLFLIAISSLVDFYLGDKIYKENNLKRRKLLLALSLCINLGFLFFFKYFNFFLDSFYASFGIESKNNLLNIILPVGISFYTFQTLSYSIDIYRKELKPTKNLLTFLSFVSFFPQLVAGPIERAKKLLPQIAVPRSFSYANAVLGSRYILLGFFKKMVIADSAAIIVNPIFESDATGLLSIAGVLLFAIQIYGDFSGYSDIAIGTAKLFNINLMTNFNHPYFALSLRDFWQRWHISLSTWFRDYLYIPLGGSRLGKIFSIRNLLITFLISGLWHGANWTFVVWGLIHGLFLVIEKETRFVNLKFKPIRYIVTMFVVLISWVFFRAENINNAIAYIKNLFNFDGSGLDQINHFIRSNKDITHFGFLSIFILIFILITIEFSIEKRHFFKTFNGHKWVRYSSYIILFLLIALFGKFRNQQEFIYFQF